ncbi:hypothetical protein CI238_11634, partial [Colletotrichum incanum]
TVPHPPRHYIRLTPLAPITPTLCQHQSLLYKNARRPAPLMCSKKGYLSATAISTLRDNLRSKIDFTRGSKQTSVNKLLATTTKARNSLDAKS